MSLLVSTKGRYALRVMLDVAEQGEGAVVPLKDIANRQELSLKYLEAIMPNLKESGLVTGVAGKGGGYKLSKPADQYTVGEILKVSEDQLAPVACLNEGFVCAKADTCKTLPMWRKLDGIISDYLDTVRLTDLL
ncbi:MAG: Rrf2 family transcriptional regulator [Candidatus Methanomethylophilaceae archaeon]|nr:Rrf2 family transcriptional regulator [Candidatus Methanomethylophilaceae archaeon]